MKLMIDFIKLMLSLILCGSLLAAFGIGLHVLLGLEEMTARYLTCIALVVALVIAIEMREAKNRKGSHG
ncbi:hypothetical protein KASHIRA_02340 [Serratia phage vB_SmaM-Kashira]|nr:hypothetical protein KASHIRA_02340 [Serratia phage vB_SmaM-Kashira]